VHYHKILGQRAGLSSEQIEQLDNYETSSAYTDLEKTVLAFAEQFAQRSKVEAGVVNKLKESLTPEQLVKLAATVSEANWTNRFNNTFDVQLP